MRGERPFVPVDYGLIQDQEIDARELVGWLRLAIEARQRGTRHGQPLKVAVSFAMSAFGCRSVNGLRTRLARPLAHGSAWGVARWVAGADLIEFELCKSLSPRIRAPMSSDEHDTEDRGERIEDRKERTSREAVGSRVTPLLELGKPTSRSKAATSGKAKKKADPPRWEDAWKAAKWINTEELVLGLRPTKFLPAAVRVIAKHMESEGVTEEELGERWEVRAKNVAISRRNKGEPSCWWIFMGDADKVAARIEALTAGPVWSGNGR